MKATDEQIMRVLNDSPVLAKAACEILRSKANDQGNGAGQALGFWIDVYARRIEQEKAA